MMASFNFKIVLVLLLSSLFSSLAFAPQSRNHVRDINSSLAMGSFFDNLIKRAPSKPKVELPKDFVLPEPQPLTITKKTDLAVFLSSSVALVLRLGTGAFTLGWKIDNVFFDDETKYSLKLGPLRIRDSSTVLQNAPRPVKPLILYEYDASPFCKRVREMINVLDLTVEYRPCPGARQGAFSEDLYQRTGRQTVPYLIDPNTGTELFESSEINTYLVDTYGPATDFDRKALWPITFEAFSIYTSSLVAALRGMPGSSRQSNARPDNEMMEPLELWGYEW
jgi:hypothetical protein